MKELRKMLISIMLTIISIYFYNYGRDFVSFIALLVGAVFLILSFHHLLKLLKYSKLTERTPIIEWTYDCEVWSKYVLEETKKRFHNEMKRFLLSLLIIPFLGIIVLVMDFSAQDDSGWHIMISPFAIKIGIVIIALFVLLFFLCYPFKAIIFFIGNINSKKPVVFAGRRYVSINGEFHEWTGKPYNRLKSCEIIDSNIIEIKYSTTDETRANIPEVITIRILIPNGKKSEAKKIVNIMMNKH